MRPLEILLWCGDLVVYLFLVIPRLRPLRPLRHAALLVVTLLVIQVLVEGPRWQMVPAYVMAILLALVPPLIRIFSDGSGRPGMALRMLTWCGIGFGGLALVVAILLPVVVPVFHFPPPGGLNAIGTLTYHLVDSTRPEPFTADSSDHRELMLQLWYPARQNPRGHPANYINDGRLLAPLAHLMRMPGFILSHLQYVATNADSAAIPADARYPILVFAHGRGGFRAHNTFQVEELVSRGYVVAAIDQPYAASGVAFPDGRRVLLDRRMLDRRFVDSMVPFLAHDVTFALDRLEAIDHADPDHLLTGHLDLDHVGMFGVSLGGMMTAESCKADSRIDACLILDAPIPADVMEAGLHQPVMWISRDGESMRRERWSESDVTEHQRTMRTLYSSLPGDGYLVLIPGTFHQDFSDFGLMVAAPLSRRLGLTGSVDGGRVRQVMNAYSVAFFDRHLQGREEPLLDGAGELFPGIRFETRRPPGGAQEGIN